MARFIYADNAATTRLLPQVLDKMLPFFTEEYGNPSSLYSFGQTARLAVDEARQTVAGCLGCRPEEVFFTSGGSEADNWAIKMAAGSLYKRGKKHIISTAFEHHAVLHALEAMEKQGFEVTLLPVHENGIVRAEDVKAALREDTALVSVMFANNEIGTLQPSPKSVRSAGSKGCSSTPTPCRRWGMSRWILPGCTSICSPCRPTNSTGRRGWARCWCAGDCASATSSTAARRSGAAARAPKTRRAWWGWPKPCA